MPFLESSEIFYVGEPCELRDGFQWFDGGGVTHTQVTDISSGEIHRFFTPSQKGRTVAVAIECANLLESCVPGIYGPRGTEVNAFNSAEEYVAFMTDTEDVLERAIG